MNIFQEVLQLENTWKLKWNKGKREEKEEKKT